MSLTPKYQGKNMFLRHFRFLPALLILALLAPASVHAAKDASLSKPKSLRLYATMNGKKRYFNGYDWLQYDEKAKLALVEKAKIGAGRLSAVMLLPADVYVKEVDKIYGQAPESRLIELGQVIQGVAINLKDWNDGTDPEKKRMDALAR